MKNLFFILLLACSGFSALGQTAFHDAATIRRFFNDTTLLPQDDSTRDATFPIFAQYFKDSLTTYPSLVAAAKDNPFLSPLLDTTRAIDQSAVPAFAQIASAVGGFDVTTFADGLGKFLAERTKEEINMAFFDKFRLLLGEYPELGKTFPATVKYLNVVMNHEYANLLPTLKEAFERDLKTLPKNLLSISTLTPEDCRCKGERQIKCQQRIVLIQELFKTEEGTAVVAGLTVADGILNKNSAPDIIAGLAGNSQIRGNNDNISNFLGLLGIVSNSILDSSDTDRWVKAAEVGNMVKDNLWFQLYMGLVYQQIKNDNVTINQKPIADLLKNEAATVKGFGKYIARVAKDGEALSTTLKEWEGRDSLTRADFGVFVGQFRTFFKTATDYTLISPHIPEPNAKTKLAFYITDQGMEITQNILVKNYSAAIVSSLFMLDTLMATDAYSTRKGAIDINRQVTNAKTDPVMAAKIKHELLLDAGTVQQMRRAVKSPDTKTDDEVKKAYLTYQKKYLDDTTLTDQAVNYYLTQQYLSKQAFKRNFVRYGAFMTAVILAKNSDEVKDAIRAVALPPGSSSIKKTTNFSITLQAYTGLSGGREVINLKVPATTGTFFNALSVYAPVGVAFNVGLKSHRNPSNKYNAGSLSAMFSLIDVGAIFSYRFMSPNDPLNSSIKLRWENIFAPGANVVYGIPKVPLSIGTGLQWQPTLKRVDASGAVITQSGVRWQLFLAFDLPMLNLYTSKK